MNPEKDGRPEVDEDQEKMRRVRLEKEDKSVWITEDEYVDWSKREQMLQGADGHKSRLLAFVVPFVFAFILFMLAGYLVNQDRKTPEIAPPNVGSEGENAIAETPPAPPVGDVREASEPSQGDPLVEHSDQTATDESAATRAEETPGELAVDVPPENATNDEPVDDASELSTEDEPLELLAEDSVEDGALDANDELDAQDDANAAEVESVEEEALKLEQAKSELARLVDVFAQIKGYDPRQVDAAIAELDATVEQANRFVQTAPSEVAEEGNALLGLMESFRDALQKNRDFYRRLDALDDASLDAAQTRAFFAELEPDSRTRDEEGLDAVDAISTSAYREEMARAAEALDALDVVERWNEFMRENGERLERFRCSSKDARLGLDFIAELKGKPGAPEELSIVEKRVPQWRFDSEHDFPTQRKILLMLETELRQQYWTYSPSRDVVYYLPREPRVGVNEYVADASGSLAKIEIPSDAPELESEISPQKQFLEELRERARQTPDALRDEDVGAWYANWAAFLQMIQNAERLDPILQYKFLQKTARCLQSSDFYFAARMEPLLRVLNAPQLDEDASVDRFQTESPKIKSLRSLALARVAFLPKDHLKVDKTTKQLDAAEERFATIYRRVGWLDRNFNGEWRLRRPENAETPAGDLYALCVETRGASPRWLKIGSSNGRQITINLASNVTPRGTVVLCRVLENSDSSTVSRSDVNELFSR